MVDGNIRGALVEIVHGISARDHGLSNEAIRLRQRSVRIIDESALHAPPRGCKPFAFPIRQGTNLHAAHPTLPPLKFRLGPGSPELRDGTLILRAEFFLQPPALITKREEQQREANYRGNNNNYSDRCR